MPSRSGIEGLRRTHSRHACDPIRDLFEESAYRVRHLPQRFTETFPFEVSERTGSFAHTLEPTRKTALNVFYAMACALHFSHGSSRRRLNC